jgi:hypothetical protein
MQDKVAWGKGSEKGDAGCRIPDTGCRSEAKILGEAGTGWCEKFEDLKMRRFENYKGPANSK